MIVSVSYDQPSVWWAELIRGSSKGLGVHRDLWVNASYVINEAKSASVSKLSHPRFFLSCLVSVSFPARLQESTVIYLLPMNSKWKETKKTPRSFSALLHSALPLLLISFEENKLPCIWHVDKRLSEAKLYMVCFLWHKYPIYWLKSNVLNE